MDFLDYVDDVYADSYHTVIQTSLRNSDHAVVEAKYPIYPEVTNVTPPKQYGIINFRTVI